MFRATPTVDAERALANLLRVKPDATVAMTRTLLPALRELPDAEIAARLQRVRARLASGKGRLSK